MNAVSNASPGPGAVYYAVMALANFVNIMTFYCMFHALFYHFGGYQLNAILITSPFSGVPCQRFQAGSIAATMMSRLMLNLHRSAPDKGIMSTVSITNMIFNISTMLSDLPRINSKPDRGHHGVSISDVEVGFSRDLS
ncbi:hypothetical protein L218DRAFT_1010451 [Marasmius fiardii PR-910]|nr:hypothetical protein L218DRAFT_1010451 [Marasmius fiardii PR-910]